ncbi:Ig-like domain-containing protein [bacterium]|nr:Ig-like domain-containing protein [bacterium]
MTDSNTATVSIKVDSVNDKPVVSGQSVSIKEDETVSITLEGSDEDKDDLNFTVLSQPKNGTLSGSAPILSYSPNENYSGSDSFSYKANDGAADSNTATVKITVNGVNDKPEVANQSVDVDEDGSVSIKLSGSDEEGDTLSFTVLSQPKNGTLTEWLGGNLTYSPKANFNGEDSFTYKANDGEADSNTATVAIKIIKKDVDPISPVLSIKLSKASYKSDEKISISFSGGPGNQKDWIAIYKKEEIPGEVTSLRWSYLDGKKSGELVFDELWIGEYNLYLLENDGYNKLASTSFSVDMPSPSFSPRTLDVAQGSQLSFNILEDMIIGDHLTKLNAQNIINDMWGKRKKQLKEERASEINNKSITLDGKILRYKEKVYGTEPEGGRSLWISMHGGGSSDTPKVNDKQWINQSMMYDNIAEGFYIAPRATTDTWNMWFQPHIGEMFDRLIENYITYHSVNPNRVYLLGYSAGGDGVYRLAPRMADRWAAASMMAGHPGEVNTDNLYNIGFGLFMGGKDSDYDRNIIAEKWIGYLADLQSSEPLGYKHFAKIYPNKPHWMGNLEREAIPWMAEFERDPWPKKIIWRQDGVFQERFYWLEMPIESRVVAPQTYEQRTVATVDGQTIRVVTSADPVITIRLSDQLVNLDEPITIIVNNEEKYKGLVPRSLKEIERSLAARPDPSSCSVASITIGSGSIIEINSETLIDRGLSYEILTNPKNGLLIGEAPNLIYKPNAAYSGADSFTYKAYDGKADSNTATVTINVITETVEPQLYLTKNIYKSGEEIVVSFAYGPGNKKDWFGIYKKKNNPREERSEAWIYVDGTENGILGVKSGQITFENLSLKAGKYDIFLFENNTSEVILSAASFEIIESPIISVDNNLTENIDIELSFKKGPGNKNNWIGIWPSNENPQDSFSKTWFYVDGTKKGLQAQTEGVLNLGKLTPGSYKAYFINNNNKDKFLASIEFNVSVEVPKWNKTPQGNYLYIARKESRPVLSAMINDNTGNSSDELEVRLNFKYLNGNPSIYLMSNSVILGQLTLFPDGLVKVFNGEWITLKQKYEINKWNELIVNYKNSSQSGVISINNTDSEIVLMNENSTGDIKHLNAIQLQTDGNGTEFNVDNIQVVDITKGKELFFDDFTNAAIEKCPINPQKGNWKWNQLSIVKVLPNDINKKKWTIMVYNQGDNNLAYFSLIQNKVFDAIGSNEDVNIIIQTDYDTSDKRLMKNIHNYDDNADNITEGVTRIIISKNEKKIDLSNYGYSFKASRNTIIEKRFPENSKYENRMDDPKFFGEFLDWGFSDFPAERYGIFFVDHGGSWSGGFGGDHQDGLGGAQGIKPKAFRREIKSAFARNKIDKFDFIKFYACLMGTAEVLDAFSDLCEVFIANPEITMLGQNNHEGRAKFISYLLDNPDISNINLAKYEVKEWFNNFSYEKWGGVHCAYDMTKYSAFKTAFESFSKTLTHEAKNKNPLIAAARINTWPYDLHSVYNIKKPTSYIDLAHFAEILSISANGDLKIKSKQLLDAINRMVIDKFLGTKRPDSSSLNITYPVKGYNKNWLYSYYKTYFANGHTKDYTGWAGVPSSSRLNGTGGEWARFLNEVYTLSQESGKIEYVFNDVGALVPSRNAEFGNAENEIIIGSATKNVKIDFEVNNPNNANDYRINIVSNKETNNSNQFIYLGEIHRDKINTKNKHSFVWDGKIPVLSLASDGSKAPPVGSIDINRKELIGEMPLYLGGWFSDLSEDTMISYADYLGPNDIKKTSVMLISKFIDGNGEIETIILDSGSENKGVAPVPVDITLEKGGKLWPLYYMEEPHPGNPNEWMPYYVWFKDGYINIPDNGKDGIIIDWITVEKGDYRAEVEVSDNFGVYNEPLKFDIRMEGENTVLPDVLITFKNNKITVEWSSSEGGANSLLQWTDNLGSEWQNILQDQYEIENSIIIYKERPRQEKRFYRLIKP